MSDHETTVIVRPRQITATDNTRASMTILGIAVTFDDELNNMFPRCNTDTYRRQYWCMSTKKQLISFVSPLERDRSTIYKHKYNIRSEYNLTKIGLVETERT